MRYHRLLQRISLTRNEAMALTGLSVLLVIGMVVRAVQQEAVMVSPDAYAELDRLFFERSVRSDSLEAGTGVTARQPASGVADTLGRERMGPGRVPQALHVEDVPANAADASTSVVMRIDINRASAAEWESLPRIGPKIAERILAFRAAQGPFLAVDDLQQVRGIGEKTLERIRPHVYVLAESISRKTPVP